MKRMVIAVVAILMLVSFAIMVPMTAAQEAAPEAAEENVENKLADELLVLMGADKQSEAVFDQILEKVNGNSDT